MSEMVSPTQSRSRKTWLLPAILGAVFLARLAFAAAVYARPQLALANDTDRYVPIANAILNGQAYGWNRERPGELLNTIGYPLFLAGIYATLGRNAGDIAIAQLGISGLLALIIYAALSRWLGRLPAFVAALLLLVDPLTALWSMTVLTETLFAFMLGMGAVLIWSWTHARNNLLLILAGLFCALASLVKPFAILIIATWAASLVFFPGPGGSRMVRIGSGARLAVLFVLPSFVLLVPWFVRNGVLWDCPTLSSVDRVTMRDYMAAKVLAEAQHLDLGDVQKSLQDADPGVCPSQTAKYLAIMLSHPGIYTRLHAAGTIPVLIATNFDRWLRYFGMVYVLPDLWRPYMDGGWRGLLNVIGAEFLRYPLELFIMLALTVFQLALYALASAGTVASFRSRQAAARWMAVTLVLAVLILILTPGQGGHERFRVPVQPLLAILIGYAVSGGASSVVPSKPQVGAGTSG